MRLRSNPNFTEADSYTGVKDSERGLREMAQSVLRSICCSCRGPGSTWQHTTFVTSTPRDWYPLLTSVSTAHTVCLFIQTSTHTHKTKIVFNSKQKNEGLSPPQLLPPLKPATTSLAVVYESDSGPCPHPT